MFKKYNIFEKLVIYTNQTLRAGIMGLRCYGILGERPIPLEGKVGSDLLNA